MLSILVELLLDPSGVLDGVRDRRRERRIRRRARATKIPCALRVVEGTHAGLGRRWTRGAARVPPGVLVFEPKSLWRSTSIRVRTATLHPPWDIPRRRPWGMGARSRLIVLTTAQATLEWLVPEEQAQRAMGVTRRSVRGARPPTGLASGGRAGHPRA